jgi:predicted site-specific integrase-resolvase
MSTELPDFLTTAEVAAIFRVARGTVVGWAARDLVEHTRTPSGRLLFYRESVEELLAKGRRGGPNSKKGDG